MPSLLTPDPSSSMAQSLVLHGRTLDLARAVTRDEAGKLKEAGERAREKADKRNLYLLREGSMYSDVCPSTIYETKIYIVILPNTPAAQHLSPAELEKRNQSYNARRALLKSNPSLYVSKTRLSVRQLPLFVSERGLKRLAIHAVRAFEEEAKAGSRRPLSEDELRADEVSEGEDGTTVVQGEEEDKAGKKRKFGKKGDRPTAVKQAKIVRQGDRVDLVTGKGRSKGYGFLELHAHADALRVLRWANNNIALGALLEEWWKAELKDLIEAEEKKPGTGDGAAVRDDARLKKMKEELERDGKKKGTLIVEFSIENVQVVQRRVTRQKETKETVGHSFFRSHCRSMIYAGQGAGFVTKTPLS
jgi:nucleolar protein 4